MIWWFIGCVVLLIIAAYVIAVHIDVQQDVKQTPRVPMFNCIKHGLIPTHLCIVFKEAETPNSLQEYHCPMCYQDAFAAASDALKKKEHERIRL